METYKVPIAREYMTPVGVVLDPNTNVYEAIDMLIANEVSGAPVIDEAGKIVGILTEKDCLRVLSISHLYNLTGGKVADFMSEVKMSLTPETDLLSVASKFLATNFTILPVLDGEKVIGRISRRDMLRAVQQMQLLRKKAVEREKQLQRNTERPSDIESMQNFVAGSNREQIATVFAKQQKR